jgi:hypothetical protein
MLLRYKIDDTLPDAPQLLIKLLDAEGTPQPFDLIKRDIGTYNKESDPTNVSYRHMISLKRDNVIEPKFKILLYPHRIGFPQPIAEWNTDKSLLTVSIADEITYVKFEEDVNGNTLANVVGFNEACSLGANCTEPTNSNITVNTNGNSTATWSTSNGLLIPTEGTNLLVLTGTTGSSSEVFTNLGALSAGSYTFTMDVFSETDALFHYPTQPVLTSNGVDVNTIGDAKTGVIMEFPQPTSGNNTQWEFRFKIEAGSPLIGQPFGIHFPIQNATHNYKIVLDNFRLLLE